MDEQHTARPVDGRGSTAKLELLRSVCSVAETVGLATADDLRDPLAWYERTAKRPEAAEWLASNPAAAAWLRSQQPTTTRTVSDALPTPIDHIAEAISSIPPYPTARFTGDGIVTAAGGAAYNTCAWVLFSLLRKHGCQLPIECWYNGAGERDETFMAACLVRFGVEFRDAAAEGFTGHPYAGKILFRERETYSAHAVTGFAMKSFAVLNSRFERVLWIDADNCPARDPAEVFTWPEFLRTGAVLWRDLADTHLIPDWTAFGIHDNTQTSYESGQMAFDKRSHWRGLVLADWFNRNAPHFYQCGYGDKDTFPAGLRRCELPFESPRHPAQAGPVTIAQHDFHGKPLFFHRAGPLGKWSRGYNTPSLGFADHAFCVAAIDDYPVAPPSLPYRSPIAFVPTRETIEHRYRAATGSLKLGEHLSICRVHGEHLLIVDDRDLTFVPHLKNDGYWESWITRFMLATVRPGWHCVDVGANFGYYTTLFANLVGKAGSVLAVEPNPHVAECLRRSVAANGFDAVARVVNVAASDRAGETTIYVSPDNTGNTSIDQRFGPRGGKPLSVTCDTLDSLSFGVRSDFIKIDAEGAELEIWRGMKSILAGGARVLLEYRADRYDDPVAFLKTLADYAPLLYVDFQGDLQPTTATEVLDKSHEDWMLWLDPTVAARPLP